MQKNKGILVVSFGTSHADTRVKTIDQIEKDIKAAFPDYKIYQAFTSKMIINIIKKRWHQDKYSSRSSKADAGRWN